MHVPEQLVSEVMALPVAAREELLALLQESLPIAKVPGAVGPDDELSDEWTEELERRIAELRSSESPGIDARDAIELVRKRLAPIQTKHLP